MRSEAQFEPLAYSVDEAAQVLGVSKPTLYKYVHREDFPSFKLGNRTLVSVSGLREWIARQSGESATGINGGSEGSSTGSTQKKHEVWSKTLRGETF